MPEKENETHQNILSDFHKFLNGNTQVAQLDQNDCNLQHHGEDCFLGVFFKQEQL